MKSILAVVVCGIALHAGAQDRFRVCSDITGEQPASLVVYLRGVQYGWENATGILRTELNRHVPPNSGDVLQKQKDWLNSYVLPKGTGWADLLEQVVSECSSSPSSSIFIVAHRVAERAQHNTAGDGDSDLIRDLASVRCSDLNSLEVAFFEGYRDGFQALMDSEEPLLAAIDDPVVKRSVAALDYATQEQIRRTHSLAIERQFCDKQQNRNQPLVVALLSPPEAESPPPPSQSEWQTGLLIDTTAQTGSRLFGSFHDSQGMLIEKRNDATYYEIRSGEFTYIAKRTLTKRRDKQLLVTVNAEVKFRIKGSDVYLLADDGKEHKLSLEKVIKNNL
ncbi:MAG TPA: hypothetical protein VGK24_12365 [Candidatus Angelobacter sp.]|jgi:hypothetical protein